jgi:Arc/MetJ-type ribon-helix-helix transcriptional regulator
MDILRANPRGIAQRLRHVLADPMGTDSRTGGLAQADRFRQGAITLPDILYVEGMARLISTTVRLDEEDVRALKRARAAGLSASELVRKGLRVVASRYYSGRRSPSTLLFESTNSKLGDESELFRDLE